MCHHAEVLRKYLVMYQQKCFLLTGTMHFLLYSIYSRVKVTERSSLRLFSGYSILDNLGSRSDKGHDHDPTHLGSRSDKGHDRTRLFSGYSILDNLGSRSQKGHDPTRLFSGYSGLDNLGSRSRKGHHLTQLFSGYSILDYIRFFYIFVSESSTFAYML